MDGDLKMPDPAKFAKLREIGYTIPVNCGTCTHGHFVPPSEWGICDLHFYQHGKHTGPERGISIHKEGHCPQAEALIAAAGKYGAHEEFFEKS
ncbi:MAG: hypothetical protein WC824_10795 [Bacteroidota bacterium]|jgi:hypothetical protein